MSRHTEAELKHEMDTATHKAYSDNAAIRLFEQAIRTSLKPMPTTAHVVDLGAGNGCSAALFKELGFTNIELADIENNVDPDVAPDTPFKLCNLSSSPLPYDNDTVDVFTAFQVIEHVENPWFMMREVARCLKPGGHFIVSFPSSKDIKSRLLFLLKGDVLHFTREDNHISFFTHAIQQKLFEDFDLIDEHYVRMPIPGLAKLQRKLKLPMMMPNKAIFSAKTLYVMKKQ